MDSPAHLSAPGSMAEAKDTLGTSGAGFQDNSTAGADVAGLPAPAKGPVLSGADEGLFGDAAAALYGADAGLTGETALL